MYEVREQMEEESNDPPEPPSARETLVANEQIKYNATYINGIAVAVFAIGGVAPFVGSATTGGPSLSVAVFGVAGICWITSFILHWIVLRRLRRLIA